MSEWTTTNCNQNDWNIFINWIFIWFDEKKLLTSVDLDAFKASLKQSLSGAEIICQDSLWLHSTVNKTEICYCFSYLITSSPRAIEKSHYIYYLQTCCKTPYCNVVLHGAVTNLTQWKWTWRWQLWLFYTSVHIWH